MTVEVPPQTTADVDAQASKILAKLVHELGRLGSKRKWDLDLPDDPTDVFVVSYPKSGTTLLQQLVYQLLVHTGRVPTDPTGRDHADIMEAVPAVEQRNSYGLKSSKHEMSPRVWKSHGTWGQLADVAASVKSGQSRVVYCMRDARSVARSFLDFFLDWVTDAPVTDPQVRAAVYRKWVDTTFLKAAAAASPTDGGNALFADGTLSAEQQAKEQLPAWHVHVKGWVEAARANGNNNILLLSYASVVKDIPETIRKVAKFISVDITEEQVAKVAATCDQAYMAADHRFSSKRINAVMGWSNKGMDHVGTRARPPNAPSLKNVQLRPEVEERFRTLMRDTFAVDSCDELAAKLDAEGVNGLCNKQ